MESIDFYGVGNWVLGKILYGAALIDDQLDLNSWSAGLFIEILAAICVMLILFIVAKTWGMKIVMGIFGNLQTFIYTLLILGLVAVLAYNLLG